MIDVRESTLDDLERVEPIYRAAFPDEDLVPLVRALYDTPETIDVVAEQGGQIVGHVGLTLCEGRVALLGPLAVAPAVHRSGIGSELVRGGFDMLTVGKVLVLGDPGYYGRFGFVKETLIQPPYPLPEAWDGAWQSLVLNPNVTTAEGPLTVPAPWKKRELWVG